MDGVFLGMVRHPQSDERKAVSHAADSEFETARGTLREVGGRGSGSYGNWDRVRLDSAGRNTFAAICSVFSVNPRSSSWSTGLVPECPAGNLGSGRSAAAAAAGNAAR